MSPSDSVTMRTPAKVIRVDGGDVFLVTGNTIERFRKNDVESALLCILQQRLNSRTD